MATDIAEIGTFTHDGKEYGGGGTVVDDNHIVAYLSPTATITTLAYGLAYPVTTWTGECIGIASVTGRWDNPRGIYSRYMYSYRVHLDDGRHADSR